MTIKELSRIFYTSDLNKLETIMVFDEEASVENWIDYKIKENNNFEPLDNSKFTILATLHSDLKIECYLSDEMCNKQIKYIYAPFPNTLAVVIEA